MTTTVVNLRNEKADVIIDRRSRWGNPFKISNLATREGVIDRYRHWLEGILADDPDFLEPLRDKRLGCWCRPLACHGDLIVEMLEGKG